MKVAVVILNWNGRLLLEKFLPEVIEFSLECAEVYVVDNASSDDSIRMMEDKFPEYPRIVRYLFQKNRKSCHGKKGNPTYQ